MKFSIIIPTYNEENYIERCLQSILAQEFDRKEYEVIVSDAESIDKTVDLAQQYSAKVVQTPLRGIAHGRNIGAQRATGEILVFVDADVILEKNFLSKIRDRFQERSVVAVTGRALPGDGDWFQRFVYHGTYALVGFFNFFGVSLFPGLCVAYRKTVFMEAGGFREEFGITEDLDLSRRVSAFGKCVYDTQALAFVSTRRLQRHALSTVLFHLYHNVRYLLLGRSAKVYPKSEEVQSGRDLWKMNKKR